MGTQTTALPDPRRRRTHHPRPASKTTPTPTRLALEPAHRHRLDRAPHHLKASPIPTTRTRRTGDDSAAGRPRQPQPTRPSYRSPHVNRPDETSRLGRVSQFGVDAGVAQARAGKAPARAQTGRLRRVGNAPSA